MKPFPAGEAVARAGAGVGVEAGGVALGSEEPRQAVASVRNASADKNSVGFTGFV
jgi:hypothetical protein